MLLLKLGNDEEKSEAKRLVRAETKKARSICILVTLKYIIL